MSANSQSDSEGLLRRVAAGDGSAVRHLFSRYRNRLRRSIERRFPPTLAARCDPSDVVQETLIEASRQISRYANTRPVPFAIWLRRIAWARLIDLERRHLGAAKRSVYRESAGPSSEVHLRAAYATPSENNETPLNTLIEQEMRQRVQAAIALLQSADRQLLLMRHTEQLSIDEIAQRLGVATGTIKSRHYRILQKLRDILAEDASTGV